MTTPTRDQPTTPLADSPTWPTHGNGDRIKPLGILLSAAGRDKHCGKDTSVGHCVSVQLRVELERIRQRVQRISDYGGEVAKGMAAELASLELVMSLVEVTTEYDLSMAQLAWDRNECRK